MSVFGKCYVSAICIGVLGCLSWAGTLSGASSGDKDVQSSLASLWRRQSTEIVSGQGTLKIYRYYDPTADKVRRKDIAAVLERRDPTAKGDLPSQILARLPRTGWQKELLWDYPVEISFEGTKVRNEAMRHYPGMGERKDVVVFDGENELQFDPWNNQVTILPGRSPMEKFAASDLRLVPDAAEIHAFEVREAAAGSPGAVDLVRGPLAITADRSTGFVGRFALQDSSGKQLVQEIFQYDPIQYADGITLPERVVRVKYVNGFVNVLTVIEFKKMELNGSVPESRFTLAAPPKATFVDLRKDAKNPDVFASPKSALDVIKTTDIRNEGTEFQKYSTYRNGVYLVSVLIIGTGFSLLGLWLVRGHRGKGAA
jgi:outer membrane lipoprotein-sorting protein